MSSLCFLSQTPQSSAISRRLWRPTGGSNIVNIALTLGITALVTPIAVHSNIVRKELPLLAALALFSGWQLWDGELSRLDALVLLAGFVGLISWLVYSALRGRGDAWEQEVEQELVSHAMPLNKAILWLVAGLILLIISSRILVWGAVTIAQNLGVSDLVIGLTIIALGTSLPELAASVMAAYKGNHDIALGNVIGSNMFNLLAVVGIAGVIAPTSVMPEVLSRDWPTMLALILGLFVMAYGFRGPGRINRIEGLCLIAVYVAYNSYLGYTVMGAVS